MGLTQDQVRGGRSTGLGDGLVGKTAYRPAMRTGVQTLRAHVKSQASPRAHVTSVLGQGSETAGALELPGCRPAPGSLRTLSQESGKE